MGLAIPMLGALTLLTTPTLSPDGASAGVRFLELAPEVVAITRLESVELELPTRIPSPEAPLELVVTGIAFGLPPVELARERFTGPVPARARVPREELGRWNQVVVTWTQPGVTGTPAGKVVSRLVQTAGPLGGPHSAPTMPGLEPKGEGNFIIFKCPAKESAASGGCTVTYAFLNPANGKVTTAEIELEPGESVALSALLVLWASCSGCA